VDGLNFTLVEKIIAVWWSITVPLFIWVTVGGSPAYIVIWYGLNAFGFPTFWLFAYNDDSELIPYLKGLLFK
jgi:hypothetical protein